jgi:hypothetical protein
MRKVVVILLFFFWNPFLLQNIDSLEKVQKRYTKKLYGLRDKTYNERLVACRLVSLELRRLRVDLVLCFKIVKSLIYLKFDDVFVLDPNTITRGHNYKLRAPRCHTACRRNFFSIRIIPVWNHLPYSLVNCETLLDFKLGLKSVNLSKFLTRQFDTFI